jgi:hypothetical protein
MPQTTMSVRTPRGRILTLQPIVVLLSPRTRRWLWAIREEP